MSGARSLPLALASALPLPVPRLYAQYLVRRTLAGVFGLFLVIAALIFTVDLIQAISEVEKAGAGFLTAVELTALRTPQTLLLLSPFVFLFGTLFAYGKMARSSEVAVMRAAGLSVWRLVMVPALLAAALGLLTVSALDPLAAAMESRAQSVKNEIRGRSGQMLPQFRGGIWLRQQSAEVVTLIHAGRYDPGARRLDGVTLWRRSADGVFLDRIDARAAEVGADAFVLLDARRTTAGRGAEALAPRTALPVSIDLRALSEERSKPEALSVWQLPEVAEILETAGIQTLSYRLRYHDLWSLPLKLSAMVLIACAFALGVSSRGGGAGRLIGMGVLAGFALFVLSELSAAVAEAAIVPVALAAWAPAVLAVLFAVSLLLYREDG